MTKNSRAEEMREKSKNAASAWLDFSQRKNKNMDTYHFFFEGYDRFYYFNKFKEVHYSLLKSYPLCNQYECGGKSEVLKIHQKICREESLIPKNQLLFFIDKDYGHHQVNSDIYMTPKYAVENFYVSPTVIEKILKMHFGINEDDREFGTVLEYFNDRYREFLNYLTTMNLWAICCHLNEVKIDFDLLGLKSTAAKFLRINYSELELLVEDISFSYFESMYEKGLRKKIKNSSGLSSRNYNLELSDYINKKEQIRITFESPLEEYRRHIDEYSRGKQLLWFLKEFLLSVTRKEGGILKNQFLIDDKNIMTVFTNCADTPEGLNEYLRRKCCLIFN